jgi:predicted anti-sigma-YlaC factor YlaD
LNAGQGRLDCSACEQRILGAVDPEDALRDPSVAGHLAACTECRELFDSLGAIKPVLDRYRVREPTEDIIEAVLRRAPQPHPATPTPERAPIHAGMFRVVLAGLVSLPLVVLINALMGWALYEVAASLLPRTIALYCVGLFAVWASMAVSLGYASLPLLDAIVRKPAGRLPVTADP